MFFGLVATAGTTFCLTGRVTALSLVAGASMGLFACALLDANNLRDLDGDAVANKRTIAVRLGRERAGWVYVGARRCGPRLRGGVRRRGAPPRSLALVAAPLAIATGRASCSPARTGPALLPVLARTARLQLVAGLALAAGLWWSS